MHRGHRGEQRRKQRAARQAGWRGTAVAIVAAVALAAVAGALESTINGPGHRLVPEPVPWGLGGGLGLAIGAACTAVGTRTVRWPMIAVAAGAVALLGLVLLLNDHSLSFTDQLLGGGLVVVIPAAAAALVVGCLTVPVARLVSQRSRWTGPAGPEQPQHA